MRCPFCKKDNDKVIDTRPSEDGTVTRRRRECLECGKRYTTHERLEYSPLKVIKKDNSREPFNRDKILAGISRALRKRPVATDRIEGLVDAIEREIAEAHEREVHSGEIGESIMRHLRAIDKVAYVRFASVYRNFEEVGEFIDEIKTMERGGADERH